MQQTAAENAETKEDKKFCSSSAPCVSPVWQSCRLQLLHAQHSPILTCPTNHTPHANEQTAADRAELKEDKKFCSSNAPCIAPIRQSWRQQLTQQAWHVFHAMVCCSCALVAIANQEYAVSVAIAGLHAANVYHVLRAAGQQQMQWDLGSRLGAERLLQQLTGSSVESESNIYNHWQQALFMAIIKERRENPRRARLVQW
jgi:N-acyl-D-aspartate/D-glutamate deacylase